MRYQDLYRLRQRARTNGTELAGTPEENEYIEHVRKLRRRRRELQLLGRQMFIPRYRAYVRNLIRALEAGGYNAAPSVLMQGCGLQVEDLDATVRAITYDQSQNVLLVPPNLLNLNFSLTY